MNLRSFCRNHQGRSDGYATSDDFRKLFQEEEVSLHLLSFLLTADLEKSEKCVVSGLEDCIEGNSVFAEWAASWARRTIIHNAIREMSPLKVESSPALCADMSKDATESLTKDSSPFASVLALAKFDRFVFVLSVLERFSDQECTRLLDVSIGEFRQTRARVVVQVADLNRRNGIGGEEIVKPTSGRGTKLATAGRIQ